MRTFVYQDFSPRVVFGAGAISRLSDELDGMSVGHTVLLCTPGRAKQAEAVAQLNNIDRFTISACADKDVSQTAYDRLCADVATSAADAVVALGGGSPISLGKAWRANENRPLLIVPTTYSGAEMAANWFVGQLPERRVGRGQEALPNTVIYDPELTFDVPAKVSAASGMNAMAHAVESLYAPDTNPVVQTMAKDAIRRLGNSLPKISADPGDIGARSDALLAGWISASFRSRSGLDHLLAQRIRQHFNLDHGATHAAVLPYAVAFNAPEAPAAMQMICDALDSADPALGLYELNVRLGLHTGLRALGMPAGGIEEVVELIADTECTNPRQFDRDDLRRIVNAAFGGDPPRSECFP